MWGHDVWTPAIPFLSVVADCQPSLDLKQVLVNHDTLTLVRKEENFSWIWREYSGHVAGFLLCQPICALLSFRLFRILTNTILIFFCIYKLFWIKQIYPKWCCKSYVKIKQGCDAPMFHSIEQKDRSHSRDDMSAIAELNSLDSTFILNTESQTPSPIGRLHNPGHLIGWHLFSGVGPSPLVLMLPHQFQVNIVSSS